MNYTEQKIDRLYRTLDFDPDFTLEHRIKNNLRTNQKTGVRKRQLLKACLAVGACVWVFVLGLQYKEERKVKRVVSAPAWLLKQADFSVYESADGELLVSYPLRGRR